MALVTDKDWVRHGASAFGWLAPGELRLFESSHRDYARAWLGETSSGKREPIPESSPFGVAVLDSRVAVGVSIFGAIFANRLTTELAHRIPAGVHVPAAANPALVRQLPEAVKQPFIEAFTAAITPIFLAAGGFAIAAFLLTWFLREVPLRQTRASEGIGESFAAPGEGRSDVELERIVSSLASGRMRTKTYERIVGDSGTELTPAEAWLLGRLATSAILEHRETKATTPEEVAALTADLLHRGYLTIEPASGRLELSEQGEQANAALIEAGRSVLTSIAADIDPPAGEEVADILRRLAVSLLADIPRDAAREPRASAAMATQ